MIRLYPIQKMWCARLKAAFTCAVLTATLSTAHAEIPQDYGPIVVRPPFSFSERAVDLNPAFEKAREQKKNLLIYMGAADCPPCKIYGIFLEKNAAALKPAYEKFVVVDIQTWIKGPDLAFIVGEKKYSFKEFKTLIGDKNTQGVQYPVWWIVQANPDIKLKRVMRRFKTETTVENHLAFLENIKPQGDEK